jgi:hypothetical protein
MLYARAVLILYLILAVCTLAVVGVAVACFRLIRRHLQPEAPQMLPPKRAAHSARSFGSYNPGRARQIPSGR